MDKLRMFFIAMIFGPAIPVPAQSGLEHLKEQPYLQYRDQVDCEDPQSTLGYRICANLRVQASDSLRQEVAAEVLLLLEQRPDGEAARQSFLKAQENWLRMRQEHCRVYWNLYEGGSLQAVVFLECLADITDQRTASLRQLLDTLSP